MERVTLEVYLQKVTLFVLCYCRRQPNPRNQNPKTIYCQTPRNAVSVERFWAPFFEKVQRKWGCEGAKREFLHVLLFEKSGQIKRFWALFSKRCEEEWGLGLIFRKVAEGKQWLGYDKKKSAEALLVSLQAFAVALLIFFT